MFVPTMPGKKKRKRIIFPVNKKTIPVQEPTKKE